MKRALALLFAVALLVPTVASAQEVSGTNQEGARLFPLQVKFHNTTAASSVVRNAAWNAQSGYTDSLVFRKASAAPTSYDTSVTYVISKFPLPPTFGPAYIPSIADTLLPWIIVKFAQDTTAYADGTAGSGRTSAMDSVRVWAEFSNDNINWFSATGTPTYRFDVAFVTTGADGLVSPSLVGVELGPPADDAMVPIKVRLNQTNGASALILNSITVGPYSYMRLLFGGDYIGQFKADILYWSTSSQSGD